MKKILIIIGHQNIKYNSIVSLRRNTGTAGELEINIRVGDRVSGMLRERGFNVTQTDANGNDDKNITSQDFDLALSLHCDMDTANQGGMVGSGDKSVDNSWQESARIRDVFNEVYFKETGIRNKGFVTEGMTKWYMWRYLSSKTPCVLIEMGEAKDPHDSVLLGNTELIASAIVRSICKAFNVSYEITPPPVVETPKPECDCEALKKEVDSLKKLLDTAQITFNEELAVKETECQNKIQSYKEKIINFINSL
jgi:hypothetical protein